MKPVAIYLEKNFPYGCIRPRLIKNFGVSAEILIAHSRARKSKLAESSPYLPLSEGSFVI